MPSLIKIGPVILEKEMKIYNDDNDDDNDDDDNDINDDGQRTNLDQKGSLEPLIQVS